MVVLNKVVSIPVFSVFFQLSITGLIAAYWTGKVITQFAYYPMYEIPNKIIFKVGEVLMNTLFISFAVVFLLLFAMNIINHFKIN